MATAILKKSTIEIDTVKTAKEKKINWVMPNDDCEVTIQDYRNMIQASENSKRISFEEHTKHIHQWLQANL